MSSEEVAELVEFTEGDAYEDMYLATPPDAATEMGVKLARFGPARARLIASLNYTLFNAVVGLGVGTAASEQMLDEIIDFYRPHGVSLMIQVSPLARPVEIPRWLEARGFVYRDDWVKVYRGVEPPPEVSTDLIIRQVSPDEATAFAHTALQGFELPPSFGPLATMMAAGVGRAGWRHYLAYDGDMPVATGGLYVKNGVGWCGYGATLPSHRRRRAQGAMFARRIQDAIEMGCGWLVTETDAELPDRPSLSYHNMRRFGFVDAYNRPNYILRGGQ